MGSSSIFRAFLNPYFWWCYYHWLVYSVFSVSVWLLLPKCLWHKNREEEDRWDDSPGGGWPRPTGRCLIQGVCISQSRSNHKSLSQYLIVLCHPQCVACAVWVRHSHDALSNWLPFRHMRFLPDKPHQTWHPWLTRKQASSRDASFGQPALSSEGCSLSVWQPLRVPGLCLV